MTSLHDPQSGLDSIGLPPCSASPAATRTASVPCQPRPKTPLETLASPSMDALPQTRPSSTTSPESPTPSPTAKTASQQGFSPVLNNRNFLRLWLGQVFSQVADKVYLVLMITLITSRFQTTDQTVSGWVSAIMIAFTIPAVLFGSVAGVFVDRWPKQQVLVLTNVIRGALVLLLPLLLWLCHDRGDWMGIPLGFGVLLGITFLVSTLTQFFAPAEQATIPLIVPPPHLLSANSLYTLTMMLAVIVGFAAAESPC